LFGLFLFQIMVWRPILTDSEFFKSKTQLDLEFKRVSLKLGYLGVILLVASLISTFISQSSEYNLFQLDNFLAWLGTRFGSMWLFRLQLTLVFIFGMGYLTVAVEGRSRWFLKGWEWWIGLLLSFGLIITTALISHSAALTSDEATLALIADFAHILAAGVWGGGLLQLVAALWLVRQLPDASRAWYHLSLIFSFSTVAAGSVGLLLLSGGYLASLHIGTWNALFGTAYGLTLLVKLGLTFLAFGIAALNLLVIKPRLDDATSLLDPKTSDDEPALEAKDGTQISKLQRQFGRLVFVEAGLALLILVVAGYLTDLQRGLDAPLLANEPGKVVFEAPADDLDVFLTLEPALVGQNTFDVYLTDAAGNQVDDAEEVSLRFTFLGQSMGTATAEAIPLGDGRYQVDGGYVSLVGPWQVEVAIRRPDTFDTFAPFRMEAGLSGTIRLFGDESSLERLTKFLTQSGGSVTGVLLVLSTIAWVFLARRAAEYEWQLVPLLLPGFVALGLGVVQLYIFFDEFTPAKFTTNPVLPDSASVSRGETLYLSNCVPCHGETGLGDGPLAPNFTIPPVNFTTGHTASHPDGDLYYWIKEGIVDTPMPAFGEQLDDEDVWHLVNYVRRLQDQGP
ncbi:MAG: CopD family protein, partial [Chloroflexota bacterium]